MSCPVKRVECFGLTRCDKCDRVIHTYDACFAVKWKRLRKRGIERVCQSCAEGIMKEWQSNMEGVR